MQYRFQHLKRRQFPSMLLLLLMVTSGLLMLIPTSGAKMESTSHATPAKLALHFVNTTQRN